MDNYSLQTVQQENNTTINTIVEEVPQLQTVIQDGIAPITTIVNAPFVEVTSVNGMTGDVVVEIILDDFQANHFYKKNTAVIYQGSLYYAKADFTSTSTFNASDWNAPSFSQVQADWAESDTSANSYIRNKPNLATVATSGRYSDLTGTPELADVATSGDYEDLSNTPQTDSTLSNSTNAIQNAAVNTEFDKVAYKGNPTLISGTDYSTTLKDRNGNNLLPVASSTIANGVKTSMVENGAITAPKLDNATIKAYILDMVYPVGTIYMSTTLSTAAQVSEVLGGTWVAWGAGRVPVGVDSSDADFDTVEKTGGDKDLQKHSHGLPVGNIAYYVGDSSGQVNFTGGNSCQFWSQNVATNESGNGSSGNLQPYITCYFWKRTT